MTPPPRLPDIHFRDDCSDAMPFRFRGEGALPCPFLAGNAAPECWHMGADYAFVRLHIAESGDLVADTKNAYAELIARVRASKHPYLIRIWNYFADINLGDEDAERYRQFCVGRAQAVDEVLGARERSAHLGAAGKAEVHFAFEGNGAQ